MPKKPAMPALQDCKNQIFLKFDFCFVAPPKLIRFFYEFSHFNAQCLEIFSEKFAQTYPH